jgi:hypothetical protein
MNERSSIAIKQRPRRTGSHSFLWLPVFAIVDHLIVHLVRGSGFDPEELACYTVGVRMGVLVENSRSRRDPDERSAP